MRDWLYEKRMERGLTLKQMGEKLNISEAYYSYIEKGERQKKLDITLICKLADALGMTAQQVIDLETGVEERGGE